MSEILLWGSVLVLVFVCVLVVLFVLMQRPSANAGMGSALGGAASESVFGGEAAGMLSKATVVFITVFFLLSAGLYLAFVGGVGRTLEGKDLKLDAQASQSAPAATDTPSVVPAEEKKPALVPATEAKSEKATSETAVPEKK